jgi:hypothetical protein
MNFKILPYVSAVPKSLCLCVIQNQNETIVIIFFSLNEALIKYLKTAIDSRTLRRLLLIVGYH